MPRRIVTHYREFAPCERLRPYVRSFFSFAPASEERSSRQITQEAVFGPGDPFCAPLFADGHASIVFRLGMVCRANGSWARNPANPEGKLIGPVTRVDPACGAELPAMVGVYVRAGKALILAGVEPADLADRIVPLGALWGRGGDELGYELDGMNESKRIDQLEAVLLRRIAVRPNSETGLDIPRVAAWIRYQRGRVSVESLAREAGVSRQYLTRAFRVGVGVTPKLYCRLARFQAALAYASCGTEVDWAQAAVAAGYTDQSHMIAEFREFSSLTPKRLVTERWFHPFIDRAKAAIGRPASGIVTPAAVTVSFNIPGVAPSAPDPGPLRSSAAFRRWISDSP